MNNNLKKFMVGVLVLFLLAACGSKSDEHRNAASNDSMNMTTTIKGGRTGGAWAVFTEGIAESIRRSNEGSYITVEPGSIVENPRPWSVSVKCLMAYPMP